MDSENDIVNAIGADIKDAVASVNDLESLAKSTGSLSLVQSMGNVAAGVKRCASRVGVVLALASGLTLSAVDSRANEAALRFIQGETAVERDTAVAFWNLELRDFSATYKVPPTNAVTVSESVVKSIRRTRWEASEKFDINPFGRKQRTIERALEMRIAEVKTKEAIKAHGTRPVEINQAEAGVSR